jgi:hypothetical protein
MNHSEAESTLRGVRVNVSMRSAFVGIVLANNRFKDAGGKSQ